MMQKIGAIEGRYLSQMQELLGIYYVQFTRAPYMRSELLLRARSPHGGPVLRHIRIAGEKA